MSAKEIIYSRKSTRNFLDKSIPKEDLFEIIETAGRTPSWTNNQPWEVYVVSGDKMNVLRKRWQTELVEMTKSGKISFDRADMKMPGFEDWSDAPRSVENMVKFKSTLGKTIGIEAEELAKSLGELTGAFMNAPTVVFLGLNSTLSSYSMFDLGAFQQSLLLAAEEKGIDSCTAGAFAMFGDVLKEELDIPDGISIAIGVALGYGDKEDKINKRKPMIRMDVEDYTRFVE